MDNSFHSVNFGHWNRGIQVQHSNAPIEANFHYPPDPEEPPPAPYATFGFSRDASFVDRGDLLDRINAQCSEPSSRVAIWGLGGVGKSQLAIEFAHRLAASSANIWVFWVHANTQARALEDFASIANKVKLAGRKLPNTDIPQLVYDWLSNPHNGKWFLVLDSADDPDVFFTSVSRDGIEKNLAEYLPQSPNGSILITTRNKELAMRLVNEHQNIHFLGPMTEQQSLVLLEKKLGSFSDTSVAAELVKSLDLVPLAISQAAAYIHRRTPRTSLSKYLADFRRSEKKRVELLREDSGDPRRDLRQDGAASNSILTTWQFSFDHIRSKRPSATDLLSLMSFFNRQGIPESLVRSGEHGLYNDTSPVSDNSSDFGSQASDQEFERDIEVLRNYSLVIQSDEGQLFEMHEIVQLATRSWLKARGLQERFLGIFITTMASAFLEPAYENWALCGKLFPHVEAAAQYRPEEEPAKAALSALITKGADYAWQQDRFSVAEQMALRSIETDRTTEGGAQFRWRSTNLLVTMYVEQGRLREAEDLQVSLVQKLQSVLGADRRETLISMSHLSEVYRVQNRFREAEEISLLVVMRMEAKFGANHEATLIAMQSLAAIYKTQFRLQEAEKLDKQIFDSFKKDLGVDHPSTLISMFNLAEDYDRLERFEDAERMAKSLVEMNKTRFGPDHSHTLLSMGLLAKAYCNTGRPDEAEKIYVTVIDAHKRMSSENHQASLSIKHGLVAVYEAQDRLEEAEALAVEVMEACKRKFEPHNDITLAALFHLGLVYQQQGRLEKAEELFVQALEGYRSVFGAQHPFTMSRAADLAEVLRLQGRYEEAQAIEKAYV